MVSRTPRCLRISPGEAKLAQIELIDKGIKTIRTGLSSLT
jgi:hypothetical protein